MRQTGLPRYIITEKIQKDTNESNMKSSKKSMKSDNNFTRQKTPKKHPLTLKTLKVRV